jgi:hypothetical protein
MGGQPACQRRPDSSKPPCPSTPLMDRRCHTTSVTVQDHESIPDPQESVIPDPPGIRTPLSRRWRDSGGPGRGWNHGSRVHHGMARGPTICLHDPSEGSARAGCVPRRAVTADPQGAILLVVRIGTLSVFRRVARCELMWLAHRCINQRVTVTTLTRVAALCCHP